MGRRTGRRDRRREARAAVEGFERAGFTAQEVEQLLRLLETAASLQDCDACEDGWWEECTCWEDEEPWAHEEGLVVREEAWERPGPALPWQRWELR